MKRVIYLFMKKYGLLVDKEDITAGRIIAMTLFAFLILVAIYASIEQKEEINFYEPLVISIPVEEIDMETLEIDPKLSRQELCYFDPSNRIDE